MNKHLISSLVISGLVFSSASVYAMDTNQENAVKTGVEWLGDTVNSTVKDPVAQALALANWVKAKADAVKDYAAKGAVEDTRQNLKAFFSAYGKSERVQKAEKCLKYVVVLGGLYLITKEICNDQNKFRLGVFAVLSKIFKTFNITKLDIAGYDVVAGVNRESEAAQPVFKETSEQVLGFNTLNADASVQPKTTYERVADYFAGMRNSAANRFAGWFSAAR